MELETEGKGGLTAVVSFCFSVLVFLPIITLAQNFYDPLVRNFFSQGAGFGPSSTGGVSDQTLAGDIDFLKQRGCKRCEQMNPTFMAGFAKEAQKAEAATGQKLKINSDFRTFEEQAKLHENYKNGGGIAAPPGQSKHEVGLAFDIGPEPVYKWFHENGKCGKNPPNLRHNDPVHIQATGSGGGDMKECEKLAQEGKQDQKGDQGQQGQSQGQGSGQSPSSSPSSSGDSSGGSPSSNGTPAQQNQQPQVAIPKNVTEAPKDMELTCDPTTLKPQEEATVSWQCPTGTTASRGVSTDTTLRFDVKNKTEGAFTSEIARTARFTVACFKGQKNIAQKSCVVTVEKSVHQPELHISVTPTEVNWGETADIEWSAKYARSCRVTGLGLDVTGARGFQTSDRLGGTADVVLTCYGVDTGEKVSVSDTVTVLPKKGAKKQVDTSLDNPLKKGTTLKGASLDNPLK